MAINVDVRYVLPNTLWVKGDVFCKISSRYCVCLCYLSVPIQNILVKKSDNQYVEVLGVVSP